MCLILEHTSLAQYGMSHLAIGMVVPIIGSLVVAFSLLCMAKEFTCLLAFQCGDCFYCCCHDYIIFRITIIMLTDTSERRTALAPCLMSYRFSGVARCKGTTNFSINNKICRFNAVQDHFSALSPAATAERYGKGDLRPAGSALSAVRVQNRRPVHLRAGPRIGGAAGAAVRR